MRWTVFSVFECPSTRLERDYRSTTGSGPTNWPSAFAEWATRLAPPGMQAMVRVRKSSLADHNGRSGRLKPLTV